MTTIVLVRKNNDVVVASDGQVSMGNTVIKKTANKVKKTLSKRYEKRNGGYTRIIKAGFRYGDNAPMAIIEFVDRDIQAKRVDKKKKEQTKEPENKEDKKVATAK